MWLRVWVERQQKQRKEKKEKEEEERWFTFFRIVLGDWRTSEAFVLKKVMS